MAPAISGQPPSGCWAAALARLHEKERDVIQKALLSLRSAGSDESMDCGHLAAETNDWWPKALLQTCRDRQTEYEKSRARWTCSFFGRTIKIRVILIGLIEFLDKIKQVGDIAVNADPAHAVLPWAVVRALLMVATSNGRQAGALFMGLQKVLYIMHRGRAYEFQLDGLRRLQGKGHFRGLEDAIIALYARVLGFLASAYRIRSLCALHRALHALWKPQDIIDFE